MSANFRDDFGQFLYLASESLKVSGWLFRDSFDLLDVFKVNSHTFLLIRCNGSRCRSSLYHLLTNITYSVRCAIARRSIPANSRP